MKIPVIFSGDNGDWDGDEETVDDSDWGGPAEPSPN